MTRRTLVVGAADFCSCAVTVRTGDILAYLEFLGHAVGDFLQAQFHLQAQVAAAVLLWSATSAAASETAESSCVSAKDVAEHGEDVVHIHAGASEGVEASTARSIESEGVILLALLRVVQHIICLCSLLELFLGFFVARITVRVVFDGDRSIRFLNLVLCGVLGNAQHFIVVSFLCHCLMIILAAEPQGTLFIVLLPLWRDVLPCHSTDNQSADSQSPFLSCRRPYLEPWLLLRAYLCRSRRSQYQSS